MVGEAQATAASAVVTATGTWSGEQLLRHAAGAAGWLLAHGLPEDRAVPALLEASQEAIALVLAGAAVRRPIAPLGPRLTARELSGCIERLAAPVIVPQPQFAGQAGEVGRAAPGVELRVEHADGMGSVRWPPGRITSSPPAPMAGCAPVTWAGSTAATSISLGGVAT